MSTDLTPLRAFRADDSPPDPAARAAARAALLERIEQTAGPRTATAPARRAWRPRRRLLAGGIAFAGALAIVLAIALVSGIGSGGVGPEQATAAQLLHRAARVAAAGPDNALGAGQYLYTRDDTTMTVPWNVDHPYDVRLHVRNELWLAADGSGRFHESSIGNPEFVTAAGRANWIAAGRPDLSIDQHGPIAQRAYQMGRDELTYEQVRALPTDVDALYARLQQAAEDDVSKENAWSKKGGPIRGLPRRVSTGDLFAQAMGPLTVWPLPAMLRAAFWQALARVPGIEPIGDVRDATGRAGVGVAFDDSGTRTELLFDPSTAQVLGTRFVKDGKVSSEHSFASGVVDTSTAMP